MKKKKRYTKHTEPYSKKTHYFKTADLAKIEAIAESKGILRTALVNEIIGRYLKRNTGANININVNASAKKEFEKIGLLPCVKIKEERNEISRL